MKRIPVQTRYYLLLFIIAVLAFWQISFLAGSMQWDLLDCYLPWKYFVSDSLTNGHFPYWNPYQQLGYPIHADLRTVWYPEVFLVSLFGGYSNYTFHFLFVFYSFLAGAGMFRLLLLFKINDRISFSAAVAYMLSGYFIAHAQEMSSIVAAAFLPFVLFYYIRICRERKLKDVIAASLLMFLIISGGYPAVTIILNYLLLSLFIYYIAGHIIRKKYKETLKLIGMNVLLYALICLMCAVFIVIIMQVSPYVARISALTPESAQFNPFSPASLISFILPFATVKNTELFGTDISMNNAFFGVIFLGSFILSLFRKKQGIFYLFAGFGLIALLASFGEHTPVRRFLYDFFPMMDKFRFPSYFVLFTVFLWLIVAAEGLSQEAENTGKHVWRKMAPFLLLFITIAGFVIYAAGNISFGSFSFFHARGSFYELLKATSFNEHILLQGILMLVLLAVFIILSVLKKKNFIRLIPYFVVIEMLIAVQLNIYYTGVFEAKPSGIKEYLNTLPRGYPLPDEPVSLNTDKNYSHWPLWRNTCVFTKKVSFDTFNSFVFSGYELLNDSFPELRNYLVSHPPMFLSSEIRPLKSLSVDNLPVTGQFIFAEDSICDRYKQHTAALAWDAGVEITCFEPGLVSAVTKNSMPSFLTLLQSDYPGWEVFIDDEPAPHFTSNHLTISAFLPAGNHTVMFIYNNKPVRYAMIFGYSVFGILLVIFIFLQIKKHPSWKWPLTLALMILITMLAVRMFSKPDPAAEKKKVLLHSSRNDFEANVPGWKNDTAHIISAYPGNETKSLQLDSTNEYAGTYRISKEEAQLPDSVEISYACDILFTDIPKAKIVISLEADGKTLVWEASDIAQLLNKTSGWQRIAFRKTVYSEENFTIASYIWNNGKSTFLIDNAELKISAYR
ncbi:MAG: hypothetical protein ABIJ16_04085 [Bacteroidota bacterium]